MGLNRCHTGKKARAHTSPRRRRQDRSAKAGSPLGDHRTPAGRQTSSRPSAAAQTTRAAHGSSLHRRRRAPSAQTCKPASERISARALAAAADSAPKTGAALAAVHGGKGARAVLIASPAGAIFSSGGFFRGRSIDYTFFGKKRVMGENGACFLSGSVVFSFCGVQHHGKECKTCLILTGTKTRAHGQERRLLRGLLGRGFRLSFIVGLKLTAMRTAVR